MYLVSIPQVLSYLETSIPIISAHDEVFSRVIKVGERISQLLDGVCGNRPPSLSYFRCATVQIEVPQVTCLSIIETEGLEMPLLRFVRVVTSAPVSSLVIYVDI